jgi:hypothetical protein
MLQIAVKQPGPEPRTIALIQGAPMNAPMQGPMFGPSLAGPIALLEGDAPSFSKTLLTAFAIGIGSIVIFGLAGAGAFDPKPRK